MSLLSSNEGYLFSDAYAEVTVGSEAALEAIERIVDLMNTHHVMPRFGGSAQVPRMRPGMPVGRQITLWHGRG